MFSRIMITLSLAAIALGARVSSNPLESASKLHRRTSSPPTVACNDTPDGACPCPRDLNNDKGVLINLFPGYQCAYPNGACTWSDQDGSLKNIYQTNCPTSAPCGSGGCHCPVDNNADTGVLINQFSGYQCAYTGGACTWDFDGNLANQAQTNCPPKVAVCKQ